MNIQAREIRYFLTLCETLNFTEAARCCGVSQPALTKAIRALEDKIGGGPLIHRERGRTHLSELGCALRPYFETIQSELDAARSAAERHAVEDTSNLGVAILADVVALAPDRVVQTILSELVASNASIEMISAGESDIGRLMQDGEVAVLLTTRESLPDNFDEHDYEICDLFGFELGIAMPSGHHLAAQPEISWPDVAGEALIDRATYRVDSSSDNASTEASRAVPQPVTMAAVSAGVGVALVPLGQTVPAGIVVKPIASGPSKRTVCLVVSHSRLAPELSHRLVEVARGAISD